MSWTRFVAAIVRSDRARARWSKRLQRLGAAACAQLVLDDGPLLVLTIGPEVRTLSEKGVIIGSVFDRAGFPLSRDFGGWAQLASLDIVRKLADQHWGGYVALLREPGSQTVSLFRAPMGDLPCFWVRTEEAILAGSDLGLLLDVGLTRPPIDPVSLAQYFAREDLLTDQTCLRGIGEIRGGDMLSFGPMGLRRETIWSPWTFRGRDTRQALESLERQVRDSALASTRALAQTATTTVLRISGGLDSSILAACLKQSARPCTALNLVTSDPSGDEREYARLVCSHLDIPLIEAYRQADKVSLERSAASGLPRPSARSFSQEMARLSVEVAAATGANALFDGGGGDNVFCSLQSARPVTDCLMAATPRQFVRTTADIAQLAQVSLWHVAMRAASARFRRSPVYRWNVDLRFLSKEAAAHAQQAKEHPWLLAPPRTLPGKAAHVALIAAAQSVIEGHDAADPLAAYSPLIVQPVVEACLAIPSWNWFEQGRNRAAARRAFARDLPEKIICRRSKGAPDSFIAEIYAANRKVIREMLGDGILSSVGLLDRELLVDTLDDATPLRDHDFLRIMRLADAEAWARCWS